MRLPRDLGGEELAVLLRRYGYEVTRQTGSHVRLTTRQEASTTSRFPVTNRSASAH
jgi:predicted RNA binding protein YcfA (HicA-like mRNA interferase family)